MNGISKKKYPSVSLRELRVLYSVLELRGYGNFDHFDVGEVLNLVGNFFARCGLFRTALECYRLALICNGRMSLAAAIKNIGSIERAAGIGHRTSS